MRPGSRVHLLHARRGDAKLSRHGPVLLLLLAQRGFTGIDSINGGPTGLSEQRAPRFGSRYRVGILSACTRTPVGSVFLSDRPTHQLIGLTCKVCSFIVITVLLFA